MKFRGDGRSVLDFALLIAFVLLLCAGFANGLGSRVKAAWSRTAGTLSQAQTAADTK